ncbi:hypothetical protein PanWU01x14_005450 [Parasponia andersonii]|uniref:Uncharacterized protein n=1 Tax=Parasponia andersonii TaxID=3476 RepID=A0A2P5E3I5_PARAD|nr:hypothetical protein PanWU01x14_005450 [Parasponia andersonii]
MRKVLASKEEELHNNYNEKGKASIEIPSSLKQLFGEVGHMRRLVASKEEELQNVENRRILTLERVRKKLERILVEEKNFYYYLNCFSFT